MKTRLQAQPQPSVKPVASSAGAIHQQVQLRGTIDAFVKIVRHEGVQQLWRGLPPTLMLQIPATTLYFAAYEKLRHYTGWAGFFAPMLAGLTARTLAVFVTSPLDMFRTNLQSHSRQVGAFDIFRTIVQEGRLRSLWSGLTPTLYRDVPFSALYWTFYEFLKQEQAKRNRHGFSANFFSGFVAGGISATATLPFDVVKTRMQMNVDRIETSQGSLKVADVMRNIVRTSGFVGLFSGVVPRVAKVAPACAIMIGTYEWMKDAFVLRHSQGPIATAVAIASGVDSPPPRS